MIVSTRLFTGNIESNGVCCLHLLLLESDGIRQMPVGGGGQNACLFSLRLCCEKLNADLLMPWIIAIRPPRTLYRLLHMLSLMIRVRLLHTRKAMKVQ